MKYKFIRDLTSDVAFEVYGKNKEELFENSALALFDIICEIKKVRQEKEKNFVIEAEGLEDLLVRWLEALIASVDIDELFFSKFEVKIEKNKKYKLEAKAFGEPTSTEKSGTVVKGITRYKFKLEKTKKGYKARICCDI